MGTLVSLAPILLMFVIFYFLLIRPRQKRQREVREMQESLQKGDKIVTIGGMHGIVHAIDEDKVVISASNMQLTYDRAAVREVVND